MFAECHRCAWEQDDFWDGRYNPLRSLLDWEDALLTKDLDSPFPDAEHCEDGKTWRQMLMSEMDRHKDLIADMRWRTLEELKALNPEQRCPQCGGHLRYD